MELMLGGIAVIFTVYRMISYQLQQRKHAIETGSLPSTTTDKISSRLLEFLYAIIYGCAVYGVFIAGTQIVIISIGLGCMVVSWLLRQTALNALGNNYGHEIKIFTDHRLVQKGIYNHIRHPLYVGLCIDTFGAALMAQSWAGWLSFTLFLFVVIRRIPLEDAALREKFGAEADLYQKRVPAVFSWPYRR